MPKLGDFPAIAEDALLDDAERADLEPLLSSPASVAAADARQGRLDRGRKRLPGWLLAVGAGGAILLLVHVLFVALLRKTTISLDQLTLPDLCHRRSVGEAVVEFQNPSYCTPDIGPLNVTFEKNSTPFLRLTAPQFELQSGVTTLVSMVEFRLLTTPEELHALIFADDGDAVDVRGAIPIRISCMLVPFTINLDVGNLIQVDPRTKRHADTPVLLRFALDPPLDDDIGQFWKPSSVVASIKTELQNLVRQILKTIALSHIHTDTDDQEIFAFTDVSFQYASRVLWNLPALSIDVQSEDRQTIFVAGFKQFLLGGGDTFISAYTEIFKNQSQPLQHMLQTYLTGTDVGLHVTGGNQETSCFSLQVLDLVDVSVDVPAKIDGKPALLREYTIHPTLKELDSLRHKCLLELKVEIKIYNPLPIHFDLFAIELDLLYKKERRPGPHADSTEQHGPKFLVHINDTKHVSWTPHEENSVVLTSAVHHYAACKDVVDFYLHDDLGFEIQHGRIALGAGSGNFSIPFSVSDIHIRPSPSAALAVIR